MLNSAKKAKLQLAIKDYSKQYLNGKIVDLDESGTRLMINTFLTNVLGFTPIEEVKTEYMIRGTYADYMIQIKGVRHFLVEVKALSLSLSDKHLRQAINYGANEGIEWALLTNGKRFDLYKIIFNKPIDSKLVFSIDLSDPMQIKNSLEIIQFLHRDSVINKGLELLWNKTVALDPKHLAGFLFAPQITGFIRRNLNQKFKWKFSEGEIEHALCKIISDKISMEDVKMLKVKKEKKVKIKNEIVQQITNTEEKKSELIREHEITNS
jgi:hypothetical protein